MRRIKNFVPVATLEIVHKGLFQPYFEDCSPLWDTCGKLLKDKLQRFQSRTARENLQTKTLSELAECLPRIPHKITLFGRLFKYKDVGRLLLLMFRTNLLFAIKRDAYIFKETG